jgi:hypothetical protein
MGLIFTLSQVVATLAAAHLLCTNWYTVFIAPGWGDVQGSRESMMASWMQARRRAGPLKEDGPSGKRLAVNARGASAAAPSKRGKVHTRRVEPRGVCDLPRMAVESADALAGIDACVRFSAWRALGRPGGCKPSTGGEAGRGPLDRDRLRAGIERTSRPIQPRARIGTSTRDHPGGSTAARRRQTPTLTSSFNGITISVPIRQ